MASGTTRIESTLEYPSQVIHLDRPCRCSDPLCGFCCLQEIEVQSPPGTVIGYVKQNFSWWLPKFSILDAAGTVQLRIQGPCCYSKCCEVEFEVCVYYIASFPGLCLFLVTRKPSQGLVCNVTCTGQRVER